MTDSRSIRIIKPIMLLAIVINLVVCLAGCGGKEQPAAPLAGESKSCETPPSVLNWQGQKYNLTTTSSSLQPGMKFGLMVCDQGKYKLGEDGNGNQYIVYSNGNPSQNHDLLFSGPWGMVLYTMK